jgi:hypothetical protein
MRFSTSDEFLRVIAAYQRAWLTLLLDERITTENLERLPVLLMTAVLESSVPGNLSEEELGERALRRLDEIEVEMDATVN